MIKCEECGEEFSYGRKINCCKSVYFGKIFSNRIRDYKWNCSSDIISQESFKRFRSQMNLEIKDYILLYE